MAGYCIVGLYDCPWFAKACIISNLLTREDPTRKFDITMKNQSNWEEFCETTEHERGWKVKKSPLVWEVLYDTAGKGNLIGDIDDFCEYVNHVFGLVVHISTREIEEAVCCNKDAYLQDQAEYSSDCGAKVLNISIVYPEACIAQVLLSQLLHEFAKLDESLYIVIRICFSPGAFPSNQMSGLSMEVMDLACPNLLKFIPCYSSKRCLKDADLVLLMYDFDYCFLSESNENFSDRFENQVSEFAKEIQESVQSNCKILVAPNSCLLNCLIAEGLRQKISLEKVPSGHLIALGQHTVTKSKGEVSRASSISSPGAIRRVHAWGWPGISGAWVEMTHAMMEDNFGCIQGPTPILRPLDELALNPYWIYNTFPSIFLQQQEEFLKIASTNVNTSGKPSAFNSSRHNPRRFYPDMCVANAIITTLFLWFQSSNVCQITPKLQEGCPPSSCFQPDNNKVEESEPGNTGQHAPAVKKLDIPKHSGPSVATVALPVISVGIPIADKSWSQLPQGTFMVQPSVCYSHRWYPIQKITQASRDRIRYQVGKLWEIRQSHLIYTGNGYGKYGSSSFSASTHTPPPPTPTPLPSFNQLHPQTTSYHNPLNIIPEY